MQKTQHYRSLDGLRGLAALSVVFLHYISAFLPFLAGFTLSEQHNGLAKAVSTTPLQLPMAGSFAVCIFFVLSGFVLSLRFFQTKKHDVLISSVARRYFRLMLPALASIILAYLVLRLGLIYSQQAALRSGSITWLGGFWNFHASFWQALWQGIYRIWAYPVSTYNIVLWTMHYELLGSFLVFAFLALFGLQKNRRIAYIVLGLIFLKTYFLGFIAGMAICDVVINQPGLMRRLSSRLTWASLPVAIVLGCWTTAVAYKSVYDRVTVPFFATPELEILAHIVGAIIVVVAVLKLELLAKPLESRPMQYLGKISFPLYLTHFIIMGSVACFIFSHLAAAHSYGLALLAAVVVSLPISFVVAHFYAKYVDAQAVGLSKRWGNALIDTDFTFSGLHYGRLVRRLCEAMQKQPVEKPEGVKDPAL
jgi:peptidoglycan/LPS O-acetylase OafA/YrhL